MRLTREEMSQVATLAHLAISEDEFEALYDGFNEMLGLVETVRQVDTEGVEPTFYLLPLQNVWRDDEAHQPLTEEDVFNNTAEHEGPYFKVPRIL